VSEPALHDSVHTAVTVNAKKTLMLIDCLIGETFHIDDSYKRSSPISEKAG
jgi:hypothetical protein